MKVKLKSTGQFGEINDNEFNPDVFEQVQSSQSQQSQVSQPYQQIQQEPKSLSGFVGNIGQDIGQNVQGLTQLPGALWSILSGQANLGEVGKNLATGIFNEYKDLVTKPVETVYNKPFTSLLDVLPFLGPAKKLLTGAKLLKGVDVATDAGRLAKYGKAGEDFAKLPQELQDITTGAIKATKSKSFGESLIRSGEGMRRGAAGFKASSGVKWFDNAEDFADFQKVKGFVGGPEDQLRQLTPMAKGAQSVIQDILPTVKNKPRYTNIIGNLNKQMTDYALDLENPTIMRAINSEKNIIKNIIKTNPTAQAIYNYKTQLGDQLRKARAFTGAVTNEKIMVKKAMFDGLKDTLDSLDPRLKPINTEQYKLHSYADSLLKQVETGGAGARIMAGGAATTLPNIIPAGPIQGLEDAIGRKFINAGQNPLTNIGATALKQLLKVPFRPASYIVGRNLTDKTSLEDSGININDTSNITPEMSGAQGINQTEQPIQPKQMITKEMAMMAQIMLPPKEALKVMNMYNLQEKADTNAPKKLSSVAAKDLSRNQTALRDVMAMEKMLYAKDGSGQIISSALYGSLGARKYRAVWGGIVDAIGTNRTGAAYTPAQRQDYMYLLPVPGDTPGEVKFKMDRIKQEFAQYIENLTSTSGGSDVNELLNQAFGGQL